MHSKNNRKLKILTGVFSILCLAVLLLMADVKDILFSMNDLYWPWMGGAFLFFVLGNIIRVSQFQSSITSLKNADRFRLFALINIHKFASLVLPARSGELTYIYLVKKYLDQKVSVGLSSLIIVRLFELITLILIITGTWVIAGTKVTPFVKDLALFLIIFLLFASIGILLLLPRLIKGVERILNRLCQRISSGYASGLIYRLKVLFVDINLELSEREMTLFGLLAPAIYSFILWTTLFAMFASVFWSLGVNISLDKVIIGAIGVILINILPINTVGSIGTFEAGWTAGFMAVGIDLKMAVAAGIIMHGLVIIAGGVMSLLGWTYLNYRNEDIRQQLNEQP